MTTKQTDIVRIKAIVDGIDGVRSCRVSRSAGGVLIDVVTDVSMAPVISDIRVRTREIAGDNQFWVRTTMRGFSIWIGRCIRG